MTSRTLLVLLGALALAGCAAQRAMEEGQRLIAQGEQREGLAKLQEAVRLEPTSAQYRVAYLTQRDRVVDSTLERAEAARVNGQAEEAQAAFRQVLALQQGQERALAGLRAIENGRRWTEQLREAERLLARKDLEAARDKVRTVLIESPHLADARDLLRRIEQAAEQAAGEPALAAAFRKPLSIEFKDAALRTVFDIVARSSGLNFVFDRDVRGDQKTSIYLRNSTIEAAVNMLMLTNQLEMRVIDANTVLVYPASAAKLREYQPLTVRSFYLSHAEAKTVAATIKSVAKSKDVVVDDKLNLVIVRDSPAAIRLAEKLVALHDVPEPEVMLDVEILEVKRTRLLDLGVRLPDQLSLSPLAAVSGGAITLRDLRNLDSSNIGATLGTTTINAKKQDSDANLLANPRIRSRNREKAKILIGERVPNITTTLTSTGFATDSVTYVDVGLKLDVEPTVYPDGEVAIRVSLEVSNIINQVQTKSGSVAYQIGTRGAQTVLRLADGQTQVLAGLINDEDRKTAYKVPAFGELPIVGRLFGSQTDDSAKTEIVLSITPRILRNIPRPSANLAEFESGTEASIGQRAAIGGPAGVSTPRAGDPVGDTPSSARTAVASSVAQPAQATAAAGVTLAWIGPRQVRPGDTITVQVMAKGDAPVADLPLTLNYDPMVLQHVTTTEGDFMRQDGGPSLFSSRIAVGQVAVAASRKGDAGASGSGILAAFTFIVSSSSPAATTLSISGASAAGPGGGAITLQAPPPLQLSVVQ